MQTTTVSLDDPRLREYTSLRDVNLRKSLEAEHGLFIAEGEHVIRRAIRAGYQPRSFLVSERWLDRLRDVVDASSAPCYVLELDEIEDVTGFHVHRGALACFDRPQVPSVGEVIADARRVIVLEDIVDHTNVGAIFRCAAALGIDAIVLAPGCADPLYRRAVKVSMGAVFTVPYARMDGSSKRARKVGLAQLREAGFRLLALTPGPDASSLEPRDDPGERLALLLGTEGDGLSASWLEAADECVRIPISPEVDSLNVAAAAAITCYVLGTPATRG